MQTNNDNQIEVKIVQMGRDTQVVSVDEGATIEDVFAEASIDSSNTFYCEGIEVESHFTVDDGDVLTAMAEKTDAGSK